MTTWGVHRRVWMALPALCASFVLDCAAASAQRAFYRATAADLDGPAETVIRQEVMLFAPPRASAYRVLYRSRGLKGEPIAVSGVIFAPRGEPPSGGRPIVAWAHPTTGVVTRCAPSLSWFMHRHIQGLGDLIARGYVVAATDYPGLGGPGLHPYLVGESEARAVLDIVRAARSMPAIGGSADFAVWGHSQGGQAALFAGLIAKEYAPELKLVGVAALAPGTDLATLIRDDLGSVAGDTWTATILWSWDRVYGAPLSRVVEPGAIPVVDQVANLCTQTIDDLMAYATAGRALQSSFLSVKNFLDLEPWRSLAAANSPAPLVPDIPLFIAQGSTDPLVKPEVTREYVERYCRAGGKARFLLMPGVGHAVAEWIAARFAGEAAPDDCAR